MFQGQAFIQRQTMMTSQPPGKLSTKDEAQLRLTTIVPTWAHGHVTIYQHKSLIVTTAQMGGLLPYNWWRCRFTLNDSLGHSYRHEDKKRVTNETRKYIQNKYVQHHPSYSHRRQKKETSPKFFQNKNNVTKEIPKHRNQSTKEIKSSKMGKSYLPQIKTILYNAGAERT